MSRIEAMGCKADYDCSAVGAVMELDTRGLSWARMQCDRLDSGAWGSLEIVLKGRTSIINGQFYEIDSTKRLNTASAVSGLIDVTGYAMVRMEITTASGTSGARADLFLYVDGQVL